MRVEDFNKLDRVVDEENDWRHRPDNTYKNGDKVQVSIVSTENRDLKVAVKMAVDAIGGVRRALTPGDRVLLKPNFNSDDPYPASTDLDFLKPSPNCGAPLWSGPSGLPDQESIGRHHGPRSRGYRFSRCGVKNRIRHLNIHMKLRHLRL